MSLLSNSQRTQEYITQIFSHCCKVFDGIWSHTNMMDSIPHTPRHTHIYPDCNPLLIVVRRPQSTRLFFSTTAPSRISPLCLFHPPIRYAAPPSEVVWRVLTASDAYINFYIIPSSGPDAGVKVFLSPGLWEHSGLHDTGEWWDSHLLLVFPPLFLLFWALLVVLLLAVLVDGEQLTQVFVKMMQRDQPVEMQLTAAKWWVLQRFFQ